MEDILAIYSSVEEREALDAQFKKMIEEKTGLTAKGQPNALSLVFRTFLQDKGFFEKLKQRRHSQAVQTMTLPGGRLDTTIQGGSSPMALPRKCHTNKLSWHVRGQIL